MPPGDAQDRSFVRIYYPKEARPTLHILGDPRHYEVAECSEGGVRLDHLPEVPPTIALDSAVRGQIRFQDRGSLELRGTIVRIEDGEVAIRLTQPIPFKRVLSEQLFLRKHFARARWANRSLRGIEARREGP